MAQLHVVKFGGSSLATTGRIATSMIRLRQDPRRRVVTISAPGRVNGMGKVTDDLRAMGVALLQRQPLDEDVLERVGQRYRDMERELCGREVVSLRIPDRIRQQANMAAMRGRIDPLEAVGEQGMAEIYARALQEQGVDAVFLDARDFMAVKEGPSGVAYVPKANYSAIRSHIGDALGSHTVAIIPGYYGLDDAKTIRTFRRGGSDYTAAVLAAALNADLHENFTDVDGIRVTDYEPLREAASRISVMGLIELAQLTRGGSFGVFQADAVAPLARAGIPIHLQHSWEEGEGTWVVPDDTLDPAYVRRHPVRGIAFRQHFALFRVLQFDMATDPGYLHALTRVFAERRISLEHAPSSLIEAAVIVSEAAIQNNAELIEQLRAATHADALTQQSDLGLVSIVGHALPGLQGLAGRIFGLLGRENINVQTIDYPGGIHLTLGIANGDGARALQALLDDFFPSADGSALSPADAARVRSALERI